MMALTNEVKLCQVIWNAEEEADSTQLVMPKFSKRVWKDKELFCAQILHPQENLTKDGS